MPGSPSHPTPTPDFSPHSTLCDAPPPLTSLSVWLVPC